MLHYCENTKTCRRQLILEYFEELHVPVQTEPQLKHNCCDICSNKCSCSDCESSKPEIQLDVPDNADNNCDKPTRFISPYANDQIRKELMQYRQ